MGSPILYELNTRSWLWDLSEKAGHPVTLDDLSPRDLEHWRKLGVTHFWLMGVWPIGPKAREFALKHWQETWSKEIPSVAEDVHGSPFAWSNIVPDDAVSPTLKFFEQTAEAEIPLILDMISNHAGLDFPWIETEPATFMQSPHAMPGTFLRKTKFGKRHFAHGRDPYWPPWEDTVQFDHRQSRAQQALIAMFDRMAEFADGFRCDMAMLLQRETFAKTWAGFPEHVRGDPPFEFWPICLEFLREKRPDLLMIAESYWDTEERMQEFGFDYTYHKPVYDRIVRRQFSELRESLARRTPEFLSRCVHFLENHDEPRIASLLPPALHKAAAVLLLGLPGMVLLHDGQLEGRKAFARIQMSKRLPEGPDLEIAGFYERLLSTVKASHVRAGAPRVLPVEEAEPGNASWRGCLAIAWDDPSSTETDLVVVNLSPQPARCRLGEGFSPEAACTVHFRADAARPAQHHWQSGALRADLPPETAEIWRLQRRAP